MSPRRLDPSVVESRLTTMSRLLDDLGLVAAAVPLALDGYRRYVIAAAGFVADRDA